MSKVNSLAMDCEDEWYERANYWAGACEVFSQFAHEMNRFRRLLANYDDREYAEILNEAWTEKWSKYQ